MTSDDTPYYPELDINQGVPETVGYANSKSHTSLIKDFILIIDCAKIE